MRPVGPVLAAVLVALGVAAADVHLLGDRQTLVPPPDSVAEGFVRAAAMGRSDRAAPYLDEELRKKVTTEDLRAYGEKIAGGPGTVREVNAETDWMTDDRASATVLCRSRTGEWRLRFGLRRDDGGRKVQRHGARA